eukprot:scaffold125238_cov35-Tisochrysis_lutea.AAC.2
MGHRMSDGRAPPIDLWPAKCFPEPVAWWTTWLRARGKAARAEAWAWWTTRLRVAQRRMTHATQGALRVAVAG